MALALGEVMKFEYELNGTGWADATIRGEDSSANVSASYLSDALGNFARGILAILHDTGEARFSFDEEPGEYRWIFKKTEESKFRLTILEFRELWGNKPDTEGKMIFEETCSSLEFGMMALKTLEDVLYQHGEKGYKDNWTNHEFPMSELNQIREIIMPNQSSHTTPASAPR